MVTYAGQNTFHIQNFRNLSAEQVGLEANVSGNEENKQVESKQKEISILGIKLSYSKAFGIVFLILFLLLFFPGIGISSSSVNSTNKKTADGLGDSQGN